MKKNKLNANHFRAKITINEWLFPLGNARLPEKNHVTTEKKTNKIVRNDSIICKHFSIVKQNASFCYRINPFECK